MEPLSLHGLIARLLIVTTTSAAVGPGAHSAAIDTETAVATDRERVLVLLDRPDVSAQLEAHGVKSADAKARIAVLTDAEVAQLAADIDDAPAGGFIVVLLAVYAVIVVLQVVAGVVGMVHIAIQAVSAAADLVASEAGNHGTRDMPDGDVALIAFAPQNLATESAPVAQPAAGDSWTYRLTEPTGRDRQARSHRVRIASVTQDTIVEQLADQPGAPMRTLHLQGAYLIRQGAVSLFSPYYTPHDSAQIADIRNLDPDSCGAEWICSMRGSVGGKEWVRVPAGQFEAIKVEVQHTWTARYPHAESAARTLTIWYSPQTKRAVKFSSRAIGSSSIHADFDLELESYSLN